MIQTAPINKIIPLSIVDGPGARTAIFVQGCNITCGYCHNPETQQLCRNCGLCVSECPEGALMLKDNTVIWNDGDCINCDRCILVCPNYASPKVYSMTPAQVMEKVLDNLPFIRGITVSGGECTLYGEFLEELFGLAKEKNLNCLIDSNGTTDFTKHDKLLQVCDGVMLDVKAWDSFIYHKLTGGYDNQTVKNNIKFLAENKRLEEIRIVYVTNEVDAKDVLFGTSWLLGNHVKDIPVKLIRFRRFGVRGRMAELNTPTSDEMKELGEYAESVGFRQIVLV